MLHLSHGVLLRTIGLAAASAIIAGASTAGAFDTRLVDETAVVAPASEQDSAPSEGRANSATYAQFFGLERLFAPPVPDRDRHQNFKTPRARGDQTDPRYNTIQSRDRFGNPGPTYRVLGVVPRKPKDRSHTQAERLKLKVAEQLRNAPPAPPTQGPLLLAVSIAKQTVTLYDAGVAVAKSPVSTGTASHPTPTGIFSVIEKQWWHRSNMYSAAPMPFMQRITWSGVALHAGELPGYAASHGCIRLPEDFALRLWGTTKIGARVIVTKQEVAPVEIAHARLFVPKAKTEPAREPTPEEIAPPQENTPPENKPQSEEMSVSVQAPAPTLSLASRQTDRALEPTPEEIAPPQENTPPENKLQSEEMSVSVQTPVPAPAPTLSLAARQTDRALEPAESHRPSPRAVRSKPIIVRPPAYGGAGPRVIVVADAPDAQPAVEDDEEDDEAADNSVDDATRHALQQLELVDPENTVINGTVEVAVTRPGQPTEILLLSVEKMPADADQPPVSEPRVMLASLDASIVPMPRKTMSDTQLVRRKRAAPRAPPVEPSSVQARVLRPGPVSVLVSRKDQRMYIRKGFEPLFDVPINIAKPSQPIGTHVFMAVAPSDDQAALRWMVVSLETPADERAVTAETRASGAKRSRAPERIDPKLKTLAAARAALDRLELPPEAVERISELASVGATLIISERGLGRRAAATLDSDFTVLTH